MIKKIKSSNGKIILFILFGIIIAIAAYFLFDQISAAIGAFLALFGIHFGQKKIKIFLTIFGKSTNPPKKDKTKMVFVEPDIRPNTDILGSDLCDSCIGHGQCKSEPQLKCSSWKGG
jgi:hypothetical protein